MALMKCKGTVNPADIGTKYLSSTDILSCLQTMSMEIRKERAHGAIAVQTGGQ